MIWLLLLTIFSLQAETVEEAVNLAFENNPNIFIPYYEIQKNEGSYDLASLLPNPVLSYSIKWGPKGSNFGPKIDAGWLAPLTEWFALPLDQKVAMDQVFKSWVETYEASFNLMLDVEKSYYETVEKRKQVESVEQLLELKEAVKDLASGQFEQGNSNNLFLLETAKEVARVQKVKSDYRQKAINSEKLLNILVGVPVKTDESPSLYIATVDAGSVLMTNPHLESLRWDAELHRHQIKALPWWRFLDLNMGPAYEREVNGGKMWGPGATFAFPVIRNGWPERLIERIKLEIACLKIAAEEIRIENEVNALLKERSETIASLQAIADELTLLDSSLEEGEKYYNVMNLSPYVLLITYENKMNSLVTKSELILKLIDQNISLEKLAGVPLCREEITLENRTPLKSPVYNPEKLQDSHSDKITAPNGRILPYTLVDGVKEYHLIAKENLQEFAPGFAVKVWGFNGSSPGPVIEAFEGDRVRIKVTNELPEATTVHWHGLIVPWQMDGVVGLSQKPILPGETFVYEFTLKQNGTYMYHSHTDEMVQLALGAFGFFIIHPKVDEYPVNHDFLIFLHEWYIPPGASRPDPMVMSDFNYFTFNGKVFPGTDRLQVKKGDKVRMRFANLSLHNHPIHLHGYDFTVVRRGAQRIKESAQYTENTVDVPPGGTRDIEFVADNPGLWALHCHISHHVFNGMNHSFPNLMGLDQTLIEQKFKKFFPNFMVMGTNGMSDMFAGHHAPGPLPPNFLPYGSKGPFGTIEMGGMFTILQVDE